MPYGYTHGSVAFSTDCIFVCNTALTIKDFVKGNGES